jgi:hypothetical protein
MAIPGLTTQEFALPAMADKLKNNKDMQGYTVKYIKADMDDLGAMSDLSSILTRGIDGSNEVVILNQSSFTFMTQMFQIVQYMEKNPE